MEFTISQVGAVAPHRTDRNDTSPVRVRDNVPASRADASIPAMPAVVSETEYDELGRFGSPAAGVTEDSVTTAVPDRKVESEFQFHDFEYRWPIEVERRALAPFDAERPKISSAAVTPADEAFGTSFAGR